METKTYTQEELKRIVEIVYDSVITINELLNKQSLSEIENESLIRNKDYIKLYLKKDWFLAALSVEQKAEFEAAIK